MCNTAGYIGEKEAAPVLIQMMRLEEGFSGGYYTGIATVKDEKIQMQKITGDVQYLLDHTKAAELKGTLGIIHSRSKSGGGDEWAHPFLDGWERDPLIAYVANGRAGCTEHLFPEKIRQAEEVLAEGCRMDSRVKDTEGIYTMLSDGSMVHMSDLMCQLIVRNMRDGLCTHKAMDKAFCESPSQVVGLVISRLEPDRISFARYDYPMFAAFAGHGAYLSSTPLAFPEDARKIVPIPAGSCGYVTKDTLVIQGLSAPAFTVAQETPSTGKAVFEKITELLTEGPKSFRDITNAIAPLYEKADSVPTYQTAHAVLYEYLKQGRLVQTTEWVEGAKEGLRAPKLMLWLNPGNESPKTETRE